MPTQRAASATPARARHPLVDLRPAMDADLICPTGNVRMQCQNSACRARGLIVGVEREALDFAVAHQLQVLCRDCRHPLFLIDRPVGGTR